MRNRITTALIGMAMAFSLAACSSQATFEQTLGDAKVEVNGLDGSAEADFDLPYTNGSFTVELESGSVDVEIIDLQQIGAEDDEDYVELGPIFEAKGLVSGDHKSFTDDDGIVRVRVTSNDKATGTITFAEE